MNTGWRGGGSLPDTISSCSTQHFPILYPGAIKPQGLSQAWGGGSGLLHLLEQAGVEIPVVEKKMSDNSLVLLCPKQLICFWKRMKGLGGGGGGV